MLSNFGLDDRISSMKNLSLLDPIGYLDFMKLMHGAKLVLTDEFDSPTGAVWEYMDFPDSSVLPAFLFANGYGPIPNPGSL